MGLTDFLLVAGAAIVGVLATAVYGMLALPAGYFRAARICAILAAIIFTALGVLWATETSYMFLTRALVVGGIAAIAAIGLTEALRQIKHHEHGATSSEVKQPVAQPEPAFRFEKAAFVDTKLIRWADGSNSDLFESRFYLLVGNTMNTGRQIKNAKARIFFMGQEPRLAQVKETGELSTDIRHGEWAFFEVGKMVSRNAFPTGGAVVYNEEEKIRYQRVRPEHPKHLEILLPSGQAAYGIFQNPDIPAPDWNMSMVVTADDMVSLQLKVSIDLMSKTPISFEEIK